MKAIRIKLSQNQAAYTREETVNNRMTYPLPPFSTIIGAIHSACGYQSYHPMEISVSGKYDSMQKEIYINNALLNSLQDDRGILIWLKNPNNFGMGYEKVAEALKPTGNSFKYGITINTFNESLLEEYVNLYKVKADLDERKKKVDSKTKEGKEELQKIRKEEKEKFSIPIKHFRTLAKGPQFQEVLYGVELLIHIISDEETLQDILNNKNNFVSLGRSEDFIDLKEMEIINLRTLDSDDIEELDPDERYSTYVNADKVDNNMYYVGKLKESVVKAIGSVYYVSKDYELDNNKRIFNKIPCFYTSTVIPSEDYAGKIYYDFEKNLVLDFN